MKTYETPKMVQVGNFAELTRGVVGVQHEPIGYFFG